MVGNSIYYLFAALLPNFVSLFTLPIYSKYLSLADYGVLGLIQVVSVLLPIVLTFQLQTSLNRFFFEFKGEDLKTFLSSLLALVSVVSVVSLALLQLWLNDLLAFSFKSVGGEYYPLFRTITFVTFFSVYVNLFTNMLIVQEKAKLLMTISVSLLVVSTGLTFVELVWLGRGLNGFVEAMLISSVIAVIAYAVPNLRHFHFRFDFRMLREPVLFSLPIIPHTLSAYVFMFSDRFILEKSVSLAAIGLYSFSDKIAFLFKTLVHKFNEAFNPHFMKVALRSQEEAVQEALYMCSKVNFGICLLVAAASLVSHEVMRTFFDERFLAAWYMIPLLSSSYIFRSLYQFAALGLFFRKKTGSVAVITFVSGFLNIALNILLIPRFGVMVAVYTTVGAFLCSYLMALIMAAKVFPIPVYSPSTLIITAQTFAIIAACFWLNLHLAFSPFQIFLRIAVKSALFASLLLTGRSLCIFDFRSIYVYLKGRAARLTRGTARA